MLRLTNIRAAEANSKLFYLQVNGRKRKNHIQQLQVDGTELHTHQQKEQCLYNHFSSQFGASYNRQFSLDWASLGINTVDLNDLEQEFTEEELHAVVMDLKSDKVPGQDGYIGVFL